MKTPCITPNCSYWVWPRSKTWLCEKCYRVNKKREARAKKKEELNGKTTIYNKDWSIATYEQICDRLRYAEEELECINMFMDKNDYPNCTLEPVFTRYSYVWRMKAKEEYIKTIIKWRLVSELNNFPLHKLSYEPKNMLENYMYSIRDYINNLK